MSGPPLIPEYLGRKKAPQLEKTVREGLAATNMPPFGDVLTDNQIKGVVSYIRTPVESPRWSSEEIKGSLRLPPVIDYTNFFMIVEGGRGTVHFMDGDTFTVLDSVKVGAIHGGPKFGPSLRYAYLASRDGWVVKYDLSLFREVSRVRVAVSLRNIAISSNGRYLAAANLLPSNLVILDTRTMEVARIIEPGASIGAVYALKKTQRFVVSLKDKPRAILIDDGKPLAERSVELDQPFTDYFIDPSEKFLIGTSRGGKHMSVVDVDSGATVRTIPVEGGMPHLASAAVWSRNGRTYAAFPHIGKPLVTVLDLGSFEIKARIKTKGPGFFARTQDDIAHLWVDTGTDTIQLIDKDTLEVAGEVVPRPGKRAMHIEFTKDGSTALVSVWEDDGAVVFYETEGLKEIKSIPFKKPVGKYNATLKKF